MELKQHIRSYWDDKQTGLWYSKKQEGTKEYYDEVEQKRYSTYYPYIPKIVEFEKYRGKKVLEIGVGMGIDLKQFVQNGADTYGIDLTDGAIERTRRLLQIYGLNANLQVMDAESLKFPDNNFDLVYSFGVLHHTPKTQEAIDEVHRVLKPNGEAIMMLYSKSWQHYIIRVCIAGILGGELRRMSMQDLISKYSEAYGFAPLTKLYHRSEIKKMFEKFSNVNISHYHYKVPYSNGIRQKIASLKQRKYLMGNWIVRAVK